MSHKHKKSTYHKRISKSREWLKTHKDGQKETPDRGRPKLEFVLKCDSTGSLEAVTAAILKITDTENDIQIIQSGIGDINHSDVLMAETGSNLIIGFQVGLIPGIEKELNEYIIEARLYSVIYQLTDDIKSIAKSLAISETEEDITGTATVIALFKSERKGEIIGCEVKEGQLTAGKHFRIISAMGPIYSGTIESMHIEKDTVQKAIKGKKVGIKIRGFKDAKVGDIIECYHPSNKKKKSPWHPTGTLIIKNQ